MSEGPAKSASLYENILGTAWDQLPVEIRNMHDGVAGAAGHASVERGRGILARIAAAIIGFPKASEETRIKIAFAQADDGEVWTRTFGESAFSSRQFASRGRHSGLLCEQFGPLTFAMALVCEGDRLSLEMRQWRAFGFPLPMFLCPHSNSYEFALNGKFRFHAEISHPLTGLIVRYRGWLEPEPAGKTSQPAFAS